MPLTVGLPRFVLHPSTIYAHYSPSRLLGITVPPAELEGVLLTHPDIADAAVIGVESVKEATELPRAYVVHARPEEIKTEAQKYAFAQSVKEWIRGMVARHKFLRGGEFATSRFGHPSLINRT